MGLVVGRYGRILRTGDGGASWTNIPSPTSAHLNGLSMNEENTHSGLFYEPQARARPLLTNTTTDRAHVMLTSWRLLLPCGRRTPHGPWAMPAPF